MGFRLVFLVQGSAPDPYRVTFERRSNENLSCYCTCPAGENGQYCKHRFSILAGDPRGIVSENTAAVEEVVSWLPGTDVEHALLAVNEAEQMLEQVKQECRRRKRELAKAMRD